MNGTDYLIDTNILVYILQGNKNVRFFAQEEILAVSSITEMEIIGKFEINKGEKQIVSRLLSRCDIIDINDKIKQLTIYLRQRYKIKLPDAIVAATAIEQNMTMITADKGFAKVIELDTIIINPFSVCCVAE